MSFVANLKLSKKFALGFSVLIAITVIAAVLSFQSIQSIRSSNDALRTAYDAENAFNTYVEAVTNQREQLLFLLLTGDRTAQERYNRYKEHTTAAFNTFQATENLDASIGAQKQTLHNQYQDWMSEYADQQVNLMRSHLTVNQARAIEYSGAPGVVFSQFYETSSVLSQTLSQIINNSLLQKDVAVDRFATVVTISIGLTIVVAIGLAFGLGRAISLPIQRLTETMVALSKGAHDLTVVGVDRKDEVGDMARSIEVFKTNALEIQRLEQAQKEAEQKTQKEQQALRLKMADDFETFVGSVVQAVSSASTQVNMSAKGLSQSAQENARQSMDVASSSEQASANVQTVATAAEELSASVNVINEQVEKSSRITLDAVKQVDETNQKVQDLSTSAEKIGDVVRLISVIADQTNILALNATIEAARAGEAGKGFAVVANEVKSLAMQTAQATGEITDQINQIQVSTTETVEAMGAISGTINEVQKIAEAISHAMEEQGNATHHIARNVEEAAAGTDRVTHNIGDVRERAHQAGQSAEHLLSSSEDLMSKSGQLRAEVDKFLIVIRTS